MRVLVVFGGRSGEHEVSVMSARSVVTALDALGHEIVPVAITLSGRWVRADPLAIEDRVPEDGDPFVFVPDPGVRKDADVAFPVLHGPYGEDGCLQGLFELADLPYVGARVEGSAICMNKVVQKRLFVDAGLPVVDFVPVTADEWDDDPFDAVSRAATMGFPSFAKPAHLGSSVGISKAHDEGELKGAIQRALNHDELILVEASGGPRELEVGMLQGAAGRVECSELGEVLPGGDWYDYRAKYADGATRIRVPADVPVSVAERAKRIAHEVFRVSRCEGLARVDFFWDPGPDRLLVNEINSIPGLTTHSMFPRVWEASGVPFAEAVQRLLDHAIARHERKLSLEAARAAFHDEEVSP